MFRPPGVFYETGHMKITGKIKRSAQAVKNVWRAQSINELDKWIELGAAGGISNSGSFVNGETAMNFTAFFSGVYQISQTIGSCELKLFLRTGEKAKRPYIEHPVYSLINKKASPYTNAFNWKETMQHHAIVWGNGYSYIQRDGSYRPVALWIIHPEKIRIEKKEDGTIVYKYRPPKKQVEIEYQYDEIFHLPGFGFDGLMGYSLIQLHREAIGLGLSQQEFKGRFIDNGVNFSGIFEHPKTLSTQAYENLNKSIKERKAGLKNAGTFFVAEEGMKFSSVSMPLADAQFLESNVFQIQEMARILNIPPHKLKDMSAATYTNIEHQQIEYITDTIRPWAERWEAAIDTQLLTRAQQRQAFSQYLLNQLQRGDRTSEFNAYKQGRYGGFLNANEIRDELGYNPIEGKAGEGFWIPTNMQYADNPQPEQNINPNNGQGQ